MSSGAGMRCQDCGTRQSHGDCKGKAGCAPCDCWCRPGGSPKESWFPENLNMPLKQVDGKTHLESCKFAGTDPSYGCTGECAFDAM